MEHNFATKAPRCRTDIYNAVCRTHYILVVFHHYYRVSEALKLAQHTYESVGIARMKSNRRFVENIKRADKAAAQRRGKIYTLALSARESVAQTVERKIAKPHLAKECEALAYLHKKTFGDTAVALIKLYIVEPLLKLVDRHRYKFCHGLPCHLHIVGLRPQARASALGAYRAPTVTGEYHTELYSLPLLGHPVEIRPYAFYLACSVTLPKEFLFSRRERGIWGMNRETRAAYGVYEIIFPFF